MDNANRFAALVLAVVAVVALAQDRTLTVLEVSVVPNGGDYTLTNPYDGGCDGTVRIDPVADQKPAQMRRWPIALCNALRAVNVRAARLDQSVGSGAPP